jgi:hypothetical protein
VRTQGVGLDDTLELTLPLPKFAAATGTVLATLTPTYVAVCVCVCVWTLFALTRAGGWAGLTRWRGR